MANATHQPAANSSVIFMGRMFDGSWVAWSANVPAVSLQSGDALYIAVDEPPILYLSGDPPPALDEAFARLKAAAREINRTAIAPPARQTFL